MAVQRNSKQRDAILRNLLMRYDHPTAEEIYFDVKKEIPSISLATVYRNLKLLESEGAILKIPTGDSDRYDGHTHSHYHFTCLDCSRVLDLDLKENTDINLLPKDFDGTVTAHTLMYYGFCSKCKVN